MLKAEVDAISFEASNVRHEHEWKVWREVKLPDDKIILPGVVSHATNVVEHPELVADRILRLANLVGRERVIARARRDNLSVRELARIAGSYGGHALVGTPEAIADQMEEWLDSRACDGFNIMFPYLPGGLYDFVDKVVPELQKRGIFRKEYEGRTLRENLGLPRPANRFFETRKAAE